MFWRPEGHERVSSSTTGESGEGVIVPSQQCMLSRTQLPIHKHRTEILYALEKHDTLILVGATGSGKSTQLVQYLREANWSDGGRRIIGSTQPRRVAATTLAARVAQEQGCELGHAVGYKIRFDSRMTAAGNAGATEILFLTDGMLVQEMLQDPLLSRYSVVVVDEAHERSINSDLLLALLKRVQRKRKDLPLPPLPPLALVVSSATIDAAAMRAFFEAGSGAGAGCSVACLRVDGRQHSVEIHYLAQACRDYLQCVVDTVLAIHQEYPLTSASRRGRGRGGDEGEGEGEGQDVLVFLPGKEEISATMQRLAFATDEGDGSLLVTPLHSALGPAAQALALSPAPAGRRKVVLATNVAETSLTLPGVKYVVDTVLLRTTFHDSSSRAAVSFLVTMPVSKQSAAQRAGRAGRVSAGKVYRLCTEAWFSQLPEASVPEIQRSDLAWAVLQLLAAGVQNVASFDFVSPPSAAAVASALETLYSLGAVGAKAGITPDGLACARLGTNPRMARALLLGLREGCGEDVLSVAAMSNVASPFADTASSSSSSSSSFSSSSSSCSSDPGGGGAAKRKRDTGGLPRHTLPAVVIDLSGDHVTLMLALRSFLAQPEGGGARGAWCEQAGLLEPVMRRAAGIRKVLRASLVAASKAQAQAQGQGQGDGEPLELSSCGDDFSLVLRCLVGGFFSHVAKLAPDGSYQPLHSGAGVGVGVGRELKMTLHPSSILSRFATGGSEYVMFSEAEAVTSSSSSSSGLSLSGRGVGFSVRLRDVSKIRAAWLVQMAPHFYSLGKQPP